MEMLMANVYTVQSYANDLQQLKQNIVCAVESILSGTVQAIVDSDISALETCIEEIGSHLVSKLCLIVPKMNCIEKLKLFAGILIN